MDKRYKKLKYQPCSLTEDSINYPDDCLDCFYYRYQPYEVRHRLWELLKNWIFKEAEAGITDDIEAMLLFHEHLKVLIEKAYAIHLNHKAVIDKNAKSGNGEEMSNSKYWTND